MGRAPLSYDETVLCAACDVALPIDQPRYRRREVLPSDRRFIFAPKVIHANTLVVCKTCAETFDQEQAVMRARLRRRRVLVGVTLVVAFITYRRLTVGS